MALLSSLHKRPPMQLTFADVSHALGMETYTKGYTYLVNEKVEKIDVESIEEGLIKYQSYVNGTLDIPYKQIVIIEQKPEHITVVGRCSCPVGWDCKHVAASALYYIQKIQNEVVQKELTGRRLENWLESLSNPNTQTEPATASILYYLHLGTVPGTSHIKLSKARQLKKGGYGKSKEIYLVDVLKTLHTSNFVDQDDQDILGLLSLQLPPLAEHASLNGEFGMLVMEKMIQTKRLFLEENEIPLSKGENKTISFKWKRQEDGENFAFIPQMQEDETILLLEPLCYLDQKAAKIGIIFENDLATDKLAHLLHAPMIKEDQIEKYYNILNKI